MLATSCGTVRGPTVDFSEATRVYRPEDYSRVREAWTRHVKIVSDQGTVIEAWAVLKSWDFRQAYIESYGEAYGLSDTDRKELRRTQLEAARAGYEIHLTVQMTTHRWNDLEKKSSPWRISLLDGAGGEIGPATVELMRLPEVYEAQFFPWRTAFSRTYLVRFDRRATDAEITFAAGKTGRLVLRVAGPVARAELDWTSL